MAQYTLQQITFAFSMVSNAAASVAPGSDFVGAVQSQFTKVKNGYQPFIGSGWSMPWGPVVTTARNIFFGGEIADNTLIVVQGVDGNGNPVYIVATAGTNPQSNFDKFTEDLTLQMVPFSGGGNISQGTTDGLNNLLSMTWNGQTLQQFLTANANGKATLVFTGHSLGGALAPALALSMNTGGWGKVYALPSAGPTAGDAGFAAAFTQKFPPATPAGATSTWNCNVVNQLDAVPLAWTGLSQLTGLYPELGAVTPCVQALQNFFAGLPPAPNPFVDLPQVTFNNGFVTPPPPATVNGTTLFASEALDQHIQAYVLELIPDLVDAFGTLTLGSLACDALALWCSTHGASQT